MSRIVGQITPAQSFGVPYEPLEWDAQAIRVAANSLLDQARTAGTLTEALQIALTVKVLREKLDAVATRALERADELTGGL